MEVTSKRTVFGDILASVFGSAACVYTGQPFDTIKVRMQVHSKHFSSSLECLKRTMKGEKIYSLWKGSTPAFLGAISENAAAFGINGVLNRLLVKYTSVEERELYERSLTKPFVLGGLTGAFSSVVIGPFDLVKCRVQASGAAGRSMSVQEVVSTTFSRDGPRGFYRGYSIQIVRDCAFYAAFFGTYEIMCRWLRAHTALPEPSIYLISGGLAGQAAWLASIAPDTIKSKLQTSEQRLTVRETFRLTLQEGGVRGLFAGVNVAVLRAFPANAALFVGYEFALKLMS